MATSLPAEVCLDTSCKLGVLLHDPVKVRFGQGRDICDGGNDDRGRTLRSKYQRDLA